MMINHGNTKLRMVKKKKAEARGWRCYEIGK